MSRYEVQIITEHEDTQEQFDSLQAAKNVWLAAFSKHAATEVVEIALHDLEEGKTLQAFVRGLDN